MIEESLITIEISELASKKGFDRFKEQKSIELILSDGTNYTYYPPITLTFVQKWLREVHGIYVLVHLDITLSYVWGIGSLYPEASYTGNYIQSSQVWSDFNGYEKALSSGIIEALKLLKDIE
jgi:hypothetical protein